MKRMMKKCTVMLSLVAIMLFGGGCAGGESGEIDPSTEAQGTETATQAASEETKEEDADKVSVFCENCEFYSDDGVCDENGYCYECGELVTYGGFVNYSDFDGEPFGGELGSAKKLDGTTVVVSVFADDANTSWATEGTEDGFTKQDTLEYMDIATTWLEEQCAAYGADAEFIYDWEEHPDLYYTTVFSEDMGDENDIVYFAQQDYVNTAIDSTAIMERHQADNIIYMLYFNMPYDSELRSGTYNYSATASYPYEIVTIHVRSMGSVTTPATYAHEILHTFGAPDFYRVDEDGTNYGVTEAFVENQENTLSNDIMYATFDNVTGENYYDHISNEFTELDAYYVGLTDACEEVKNWGLAPSQYQ